MTRKELYFLAGLTGLSVGTFLSAVFTLISPLPVAYCFKRFNRRIGIALVLLSTVLIAALSGSHYGFLFLMVPGLVGAVIGLQIQKVVGSLQKLMLRTFISIFLIYGAVGLVVVTVIDQEFISKAGVAIDRQVDRAYQAIPADTSTMGLTGKTYKGPGEIKTYIRSNGFSFLVIALVVLLVVNIFFIAGFFPDLPDRRELSRWKVPEQMIWVTLGSGFLLVTSSGSLSVVAENIFRISLVPYFFQGIAIVAYYLNGKNLPGFMNTAIIVGMGLFLAIPSTIVGFVDHWVNLRRPGKMEGV